MLTPKNPRRPLAAIATAVLLAMASFTSSAQVLAPAPAGSACEWTEPGGNTAYPETHARYFRLTIPRNRGRDLRLRIDGDYLATRYFSYQLYGAAFNALDVLADHQIVPDPGSQSPFAGITRIDPTIRPGGRYTVFVEFADKPVNPAPNTLYAGSQRLPLSRHYLFLRAYLSVGHVPLPAVRYERSDGSLAPDSPIDRVSCAEDGDAPTPFGLRDTASDRSPAPVIAAGRGLTAAIAVADRPSPASREVRFEVYRGLGSLGTGVVYNQNAGFMSARIEGRDELVLVRYRAPSFPRLRGAIEPDVRYWSLCQNRQLLQTVVACVADRDAVIDRSGFFNAVIGDIGGRPPGADAAHGFSYLPSAGLVDNGFLIYRQILTRPGFDGAITAVTPDSAPEAVLGDYHPQGSTCPRTLFTARVAAGDSPAQVFAACRAAR